MHYLPNSPEMKNSAREHETALQLRLVLKNSPASMAILDEEFRYIVASELWVAYFSLKGEYIGLKHFDICKASPLVLRSLFKKCLHSSEPACQEFPVCREGEEKWLRCDVEPWTDDTTGKRGITVSLHDVTRAHWAEEAVRRKNAFVKAVCHKIRTPLNSIIGFAEIIREERMLNRIKLQTRMITNESDTMLELLNDLLDQQRIECGEITIKSQPFDLRFLVEDVAKVMKPLATEQGEIFVTEYDNELYRFRYGDALRLRQILVNLVSNAIKFTDQGSIAFEVEAESPDSSVVLFKVRDNGIGIPKASQEGLLSSPVAADSGVGLKLGYRLAKMMGGNLSFESTSGEGTVFTLRIDLKHCDDLAQFVKLADARGRRRVIPSRVRKAARILLAEDHVINRQVIEHHLSEAGHDVTCVDTGVEAVALSKIDDFDLILMDFQLPGMNGSEAAKLIRETGTSRNRRIPIVGLTASADTQTAILCQDVGMDEVVLKPIRRESFMGVVTHWLAQSYSIADGDKTVDLSHSMQAIMAPDDLPADVQVLMDEYNGDRELVEKLLTKLIETIESEMPLLTKSVDTGDFQTVSIEASRIQDGAANLVAIPLSEAAQTLAKHCDAHDKDRAREAMSFLIHELQRLKNYMQQTV